MQFCPHFNKVAYQETLPGQWVMFRLRCKRWSCAYCSKINQDEWKRHLRKRIPEISSNWWMMTITAHEKTRSDEMSLNNIRSNVDRLFKRIKRVWKNVEYTHVYEKHPLNGGYHMHAVLSGCTDRVQKHVWPNGSVGYYPAIQEKSAGNISSRTWLRRTARSMGMGYEVDLSPVSEVGRVTGYVIKYLQKASAETYAKGLRRIQTSRKVGSPKRQKAGGWSVDKRLYIQKLQTCESVYDADTKLRVPDDYWKTHLAYPE